jgi:hypothetical protein
LPLDRFTVVDDCAFFRPEGRATWQSFVALLEQAMSECREARVTKLLVNVALLSHAPLSVADRFSLASEMARVWDRSIRIVVVVRPDHRDQNHFVQLVAANRGLRIGVSGTEDEGLTWLAASETEASG